MCVSMAPAAFSGTTLFVGRKRHPQYGPIEVLCYQNTAVNLAAGSNAMLLHLPARAMSPRHFVSVGRHSHILNRMVDAVRPVDRGAPAGMDWMGEEPGSVQIFEHDIYTVLLAEDPILIPNALQAVPERKRPELDPRLMEFYAEFYPGHSIAVCCFDNADARQAKPLLLWYRPIDPEVLTAPAVDCHTGGPPDLREPVATDHWVVLGTDDAPVGWGSPVDYGHGMRHKLRAFLPDRVIGAQFTGTMPNGDFAITHSDLLAGHSTALFRLRPGERGVKA
jgi:hypothetical protein